MTRSDDCLLGQNKRRPGHKNLRAYSMASEGAERYKGKGIEGQGRDMSKRGYFILLSWVVALVGAYLVYMAFLKGAPRDFLYYWLTLLAVSLSFVLTGGLLGKMRVLLALPSFVAMGLISLLTIPPSGYGGQDVQNAFISVTFFSVFVVFSAWQLRRRDWRTYLALVFVQLLSFALVLSGAGPGLFSFYSTMLCRYRGYEC